MSGVSRRPARSAVRRIATQMFGEVDLDKERVVERFLHAAKDAGFALVREPDRKPAQSPPNLVDFHGLIVDSAQWRASYQGADLRLARLQFLMLRELVNARGNVVTREQLFARIWGSAEFRTRSVETYMMMLIRKEMRRVGVPLTVATVRSMGYRLEPAGASAL